MRDETRIDVEAFGADYAMLCLKTIEYVGREGQQRGESLRVGDTAARHLFAR